MEMKMNKLKNKKIKIKMMRVKIDLKVEKSKSIFNGFAKANKKVNYLLDYIVN